MKKETKNILTSYITCGTFLTNICEPQKRIHFYSKIQNLLNNDVTLAHKLQDNVTLAHKLQDNVTINIQQKDENG
jgi:hypothetical protein